MTLEKIRAALPTHIMLTPGVHRWRERDDMLVGGEWFPIEYETDGEWYGKPVKIEARRPVPRAFSTIRRSICGPVNMAGLFLHGKTTPMSENT